MFKLAGSALLSLFLALPAQATLSPELVGIIARGLQRSKGKAAVGFLAKDRPDILNLVKIQVSKTPAEMRALKSMTADEITELNTVLGDAAHAKWVQDNASRGVNFKKMTTDAAGSTIGSEEQLIAYFKANNIPEKYQVKNADGTYKFYRKGIKKDGSPDPSSTTFFEDLLGVKENRFLSRVNRDNNEIAAVALVSFTQQWLKKGGKIDDTFYAAAGEVNHEIYMHNNAYLAAGNPDFVPFAKLPIDRVDLDLLPVNAVLTNLDRIRKEKAAAASIRGTGDQLRAVKSSTVN